MQNKQFILFIQAAYYTSRKCRKILALRNRISLLLLYFLSFSMVTQAQIKSIKPFGKIRAIVVGVSDYQDEKISDLSFAHRDAEAFATFLKEESAWQAAPEDVILLTNAEATYARFINELEAISKKCKAKDRLYIYFSGHGDVEQVSDEKMGYLLFHDVSPTTYASGGACMVNTLDQHLSNLVLNQGVEVILISDACRSGALAGSKFGGPEATAAAVSSLFENTVRILSCQPDQVSVEGENWGGGRGLFSYYLVDGLKGMADEDQNRYVNKFELERYVQDQVRAANRKQLPFANGSDNKRLSKVDPDLLANSEAIVSTTTEQQEQVSKPGIPDTNWQAYLDDFRAALAADHLLFPAEGSAYAIYQSLGNSAQAQPFKALMKVDLASALQNEAQQALNDYITSPARELNKRWTNNEVYAHYPDYLSTAADLLGQESYFYADVKSREHYFRGVNLRLASKASDQRDSLLELALTEQEKALALQPVAPHIYNEIGIVYRRLKRNTDRLNAFQKAHSLSPRWSLALNNLAYTMMDLSRYPLAEKMYKDAIELDPNLPMTYFNLGYLYEQMQEFSKAVKMYELTIEKDSEKEITEAYYNLGNILIESDSTIEIAEKYLKRYVELETDDIYGYQLLGYLYMLVDKDDLAIQTISRAFEIDKEDEFVLESLGDLYFRKKDYERSKNYWERLIKLNDTLPNYFLGLAKNQVLLNTQQDAIKTIGDLFNSGFKELDTIEKDPIFIPLLKDKKYQQLRLSYFPDRK